MNVSVKCFAQLARDAVCDHSGGTPHDLRAGATVNDLIDKLGLPREQIKLVFVNSRIVPAETTLNEGDQVALAPATGGM